MLLRTQLWTLSLTLFQDRKQSMMFKHGLKQELFKLEKKNLQKLMKPKRDKS
jgi:hypothetical protein